MATEEEENAYQTRYFSVKAILLTGTAFVVIVIALNRFARYVFNNLAWFDCSLYWPTSIGCLRVPGLFQMFAAAAALLLFILSIIILRKTQYRIFFVILTGLILVIVTNMSHGWSDGFITPISGGRPGSFQYYYDAVRIEKPADFLSRFTEMQDELCVHSRTHPPGAVFAIYYLNILLRSPALISLVIAFISVSLTAFFLYKIVLLKIDDKNFAGYITFLFILIPAVQIFFAASIDSLVAAFLTGSLYSYLKPRSVFSSGIVLLFLVLSSFLTFGFVFILPVMLGYDIITKRSLRGFVLITISLILFYLLVYLLSGFDYIYSFSIASTLENPGGFYLLTDPLSYIFSRIESTLDIAIFLGPFIFVLLWRGLKIAGKGRSELSNLSIIAISVFVLMLLAGAYRTGETARICLYLYPYLILPVVFQLKEMRLSEKHRIMLLAFVFIQSVLMQMMGNYFW